MRVVVLGEGTDELGRSWKDRSLLETIPHESQGALERLVSRLGEEVCGCQITIVSFRRPRSRHGSLGQPGLHEILTDPNLLSTVLYTTLAPADPKLRTQAAQALLVVCDADKEPSVRQALAGAPFAPLRPTGRERPDSREQRRGRSDWLRRPLLSRRA